MQWNTLQPWKDPNVLSREALQSVFWVKTSDSKIVWIHLLNMWIYYTTWRKNKYVSIDLHIYQTYLEQYKTMKKWSLENLLGGYMCMLSKELEGLSILGTSAFP